MAFDVEKESSRRGIDEDTTAWSAISDMKKGDMAMSLLVELGIVTYKKKAAIKACTVPEVAMTARLAQRRPAAEKRRQRPSQWVCWIIEGKT